jgi:hypothetical protein
MNLQSEAIDQIVPALIKARGSFKAAVRDAKNDAFKRNGVGSGYATLDSVIDAVTESLLANGIYYTQPTDVVDGRTMLYTRFIHSSGQWIGGTYPIHPIKNDPQGEGSALTYARRYALMALAGIAPEDDDGNAATKAATKDNKRQPDNALSGQPRSGVWNDYTNEHRESLEHLAISIGEYMDMGDVQGAYEAVNAKGLDADLKAAFWDLLPSQTRTALKKHHDKQSHVSEAA